MSLLVSTPLPASTSNKNSSSITSHSIEQFKPILDDIEKRFAKHKHQTILAVSISEQKLFHIENNQLKKIYTISTAEKGAGNLSGSNKTPLGMHRISHKYGKNAKSGTIFKARGNTRRIAKILSEPDQRSKADNITSRIMWLKGLEKGINRGKNNKGQTVDSHKRYIYIHGTDEEGRLGSPASHGCIRMSNKDVIELFENAPVDSLVTILK